MSIKSYSESEIRAKILSKVKPEKINKDGKHWKGYIYLGSKLVGKVKIPNDHTRLMHASKSKYIAESLKISEDDFNALIDCTLSGPDYYAKITSVV